MISVLCNLRLLDSCNSPALASLPWHMSSTRAVVSLWAAMPSHGARDELRLIFAEQVELFLVSQVIVDLTGLSLAGIWILLITLSQFMHLEHTPVSLKVQPSLSVIQAGVEWRKAQFQLTATSASQVQVFLLSQPPK
ncbi:hypothetical protein AAY473_036173 [Plecturocebus cupreus]